VIRKFVRDKESGKVLIEIYDDKGNLISRRRPTISEVIDLIYEAYELINRIKERLGVT